MPYPNEHACRLRQPGEFKPGSFRRVERESNGRRYSIIMGRRKGEKTMTEQAYRYPKGTWTIAQARAHCEAHDGLRFEPAAEAEGAMNGFLYSELTIESLLTGKPFDALAAGTFTDMHGREIVITKADLAKIVENTREAIAATATESGEIVGLPIDAHDHDKGDGAGWIVDVDLEEDRIRFVPKWTEIGRELITKGIRRFFSATVDVANKVALGGTLTNWPAVRDGKGRVMLRPIELCDGLYYAEAELDETGGAGMLDLFRKMVDDALRGYGLRRAETEESKHTEGEGDMGEKNKINLDDLTDEQRAELMAQAEAELASKIAPGENDRETAIQKIIDRANLQAFADVADLEQVRKSLYAGMREALAAELKRAEEHAGTILADMMADLKRTNHIAEFSKHVTEGTEDVPRALPVTMEEVERALSPLDDKNRAAVEAILEKTWRQGLTEFSELGHGKRGEQKKELPKEYADALDAGELTLADLRKPAVAMDIGSLDQYEIKAEWKEA